ncbi:MAG: cache domain-containing protein [Candidatus Methylacidiphilales bacterium]|nr:cache domain-containing protein [Candidatus Methylacidiphilales bacterium]
MKFTRDAAVILIIAVLIVVSGLTYLSTQMFRGLTEEVEQEQFSLMETILNTSLRDGENRALAQAELMANLPDIRKIFATRDRAALLAECQPSFILQKEKYGVDQMQFHVPPATSFLRLHSPDKFGDDLSVFRPMVRLVNTDNVSRKGLVVARSGPAIFGVAAIKDLTGTHTGSVDVGLNFGPVLDALKASYKIDLALFISEEPLRKFATDLPGDVITEQNRRGKYIKFHSTHWDRLKELVMESDLAKLNETRYTRTVRGVTYGVVLVPLLDPAGEPLGVFAAVKDFSASRAAAGKSLVWQSLLALFAIVILAGAILVVIRGFLLRPLEVLTERFEEMVDGKEARPIEGDFCVEMQKFADNYERLRLFQSEQQNSATPPVASPSPAPEALRAEEKK